MILTGKLIVTDADVAKMIAKSTLPKSKVTKIRVSFQENGIHVSGEYKMAISLFVPFETIWTPTVKSELIQLTFQTIKITKLGFNVNLFKSLIFDDIAKFAEDVTEFAFKDGVVTVDCTNAFLPLNLTAVLLEEGQLTFVAGG